MIRNIVFACAAVAAFGMTLERPNNLAEARRRCCYNQDRYSCCQTGYQTAGYQNQYVDQCGQTYGQGGQYQSPQGGETTAPAPAPAPAPDNRSTYYRGNAGQEIRRNGSVPPPAPVTQSPPPAPGATRTLDNDRGTTGTNKTGTNAPIERPASPAPNLPE